MLARGYNNGSSHTLNNQGALKLTKAEVWLTLDGQPSTI